MQYDTDNVGFTYKTYGETLYFIDFPTISITFIRICRDSPVKSKVITCNACIFFSCNIYMCTQSENYGDFRQDVSPAKITCTLQGTPSDTGILHILYGGNICSAFLNFHSLIEITTK